MATPLVSFCFGVVVGLGSLVTFPLCSLAQVENRSVLPLPDFKFQGKVGRTYLESDPPHFPQPTEAPAGAPNVVLVLLDDTGFGQYSAFGGGVPSPTLDRLAAEGLRFNRFHTTALCSPTRAALITGRNHHNAATGAITEAATGYDGYTCVLPRSCGTIAEVLRQNGYMTAWVGKNHNTPAWETSAVGPFDRWANGLGFDYFYGFNAGDMNHWDPILYENRNLVPRSEDPDYHLTEDLADKAIAWLRKVKSIAPDKPYFLYVAPGANHSPHHAPADWITRFEGQFDNGWDAYREATLKRQIAMGVVPEGTRLTRAERGAPRLGLPGAWAEEGVRPDDGGLCGLRGPCRSPHGPSHRRRSRLGYPNRQWPKSRLGASAQDHSDQVLARRRNRRRSRLGLGGRFHLRAPVQVHWSSREGDGRSQVIGPAVHGEQETYPTRVTRIVPETLS